LRKVLLVGGLSALLAVGLAQPAAAGTTWSGHCDQLGFISFFPTRKVLPEPAGYEIATKGTCHGVLNGKPFDGPANLFAHADMHSPMGCLIGESLGGSPAYMRFARGALDVDLPPAKKKRLNRRRKDPKDAQLDVSIDEMNINLVQPLHIAGVYRGHGLGTAQFLIGPDELPERMRECAEEGVPGLPISFEFDTVQDLHG